VHREKVFKKYSLSRLLRRIKMNVFFCDLCAALLSGSGALSFVSVQKLLNFNSSLQTGLYLWGALASCPRGGWAGWRGLTCR
jgi:hypothetical protein